MNAVQSACTTILGTLVLLTISLHAGAEDVSKDVDLSKDGAASEWTFTKKEASIRNGELVLEGLKEKHIYAFLNEPVLSDFRVRFKVYVEPEGEGVRAFGVRFHSPDSLCAQFVHVYPRRAVLAWADREKDFHEAVRNDNVDCREGAWHDFELGCEGTSVKAYLDGKLIFDQRDDRWKAGRLGFHPSQALVHIKDIRLEGTPADLPKPWQIVKPLPADRTFHRLPADYRHTDVSGKLEITVSEPFIISSTVTHPERGAHLFPTLARLRKSDDDVFMIFNKEGDFLGARRNILRSPDGGKTWSSAPCPVNGPMVIGTLADGTVLCYDFYGFMKEPGLFCKEMGRSTDGGHSFEERLLTFVHSPLSITTIPYPEECVSRYRKTSAQWSGFVGGNFSRTLLELDDGSLLVDGCAVFKDAPDKGFYKHIRIVLYHSTDKGKSWRYHSTVAYDPKIGFHEPVMARCSDGSILCMMRVGGGLPMMQTRSRDNGKTWDKPRENGSLGVYPDMCLMTGGVLACSYGRPGNRIMFDADGTGEKWTDRIKIFEYKGGSTGYTAITEVEPGKLLLLYDRQGAFPQYDGKTASAVCGVHVTVGRKK